MTEERKGACDVSAALAQIKERLECLRQLMEEADRRYQERFLAQEERVKNFVQEKVVAEIEKRYEERSKVYDREQDAFHDRMEKKFEEYLHRLEEVEKFQALRKGEMGREKLDVTRTMWLIGLLLALVTAAIDVAFHLFRQK